MAPLTKLIRDDKILHKKIDPLCCITNCRNTNIPLQQQMAAEAHVSNFQKWSKMAICESQMTQNYQKLPKMAIFGSKMVKMIFKKNPPQFPKLSATFIL